MNRSRFVCSALCFCTTVLLAACGGSQLPLGAPHISVTGILNRNTRHFVVPEPGLVSKVAGAPAYKMSGSLLYVVNFVTDNYQLGDVAVYDAKADNPSPIAIITNGVDAPNGDCIDATGILYVANQSGYVAEYAPGKTKPFQYITRGQGTPVACTIDSKGNLWVAAISDVIEYLKGSNQPHKFIQNGVTYANSVVFDHRGNMYVGNLGDPYYHLPFNVQVYAPGRNAPSRTITDGITWPVGTAVDASDKLYVANDNAPCNVEEYRVGQSHPFRTITDDIDGPVGLTFDETGRLYESNGGTQGCTTNGPYPLILEFPRGSVRPSRRTINTLRDPSGLAYYPPQLP